LNSAIFSANPT
jgi:hypothetical protein